MVKKITFLFCFFLLACQDSKVAPINNNVGTPITIDQARQALAKGINLSNWFNDYSDPGQYATRFTSADMQKIKNSGFTFVRLPIGSNVLFNASNPSSLQTGNLTLVDTAVKLAHQAGLAVLLDAIHDSNDTFEKRLASENGFVDKAKVYWQAVATYFSKYDTDKIFFEVYNEPHIGTSGVVSGVTKSWWWPVQSSLVQAIRQVTINHFIVAGAEGWNSRQDLISNVPYNQPNVIYNFHFYDPFIFTHQGATWAGWAPAVEAYHVVYPSSPAGVDSIVHKTPYQDLKDVLTWYGNQKYNYDSLNNWIKPVNNWAKLHNVAIMCNEFGSYKPYSPRQSRLNWIHDTRTALEANQVMWAMWECDEGFGWIDYAGANRSNSITDTDVLTALGL
jgi:aryl-phospho-beta-D-glucosidase BglC (GH1 family)